MATRSLVDDGVYDWTEENHRKTKTNDSGYRSPAVGRFRAMHDEDIYTGDEEEEESYVPEAATAKKLAEERKLASSAVAQPSGSSYFMSSLVGRVAPNSN